MIPHHPADRTAWLENPWNEQTSFSDDAAGRRTPCTRLWNAELLDVIAEAAPDFTAPQKAEVGGGGLVREEIVEGLQFHLAAEVIVILLRPGRRRERRIKV